MRFLKSSLVFSLSVALLAGCDRQLPQSAKGAVAPVAAPQLSSFFSDHMVVQRDQKISVWGRTEPGQEVTVHLGPVQAQTTADDHGKWKALLPAMPAGGPYNLTLSGHSEPVVRDVMVGDVWLCSGQSNMQFSVARSASAKQALASANHPNIRLFDVKRAGAPTPQEDFVSSSQWQAATPDTVKSFSAVCYYFAEQIHNETGVPLGLVASAWGGSLIESWISRDALDGIDDFNHELGAISDYLRSTRKPYNTDWLQDLITDWLAKAPADRLNDRSWTAMDMDDSQWGKVAAPGLWKKTALENKDGIIWLRKAIDLPEDWSGKAGRIRLGRAYERDEVWVNGSKVGQGYNYQKKLDYDIPAGLLREGRNVVAVRLLDRDLRSGGSLGQPNLDFDLLRSDTKDTYSLAGEWRFKVGISIDELPVLPTALSFDRHTPTALYNAMINPLLPNRFKGVLWYQGEANSALPEQYARLLPIWAANWRKKFNNPELPFYIVQLPDFEASKMKGVAKRDWPSMRNVQRQAALNDPLMYMAVTIELGNAKNIHPRNKRDVGHRLAFEALRASYGRSDVPATARVEKVSADVGNIYVRFADNIKGLQTSDGKMPRLFSVCDASHSQCQPVAAKLKDSHTVELSGLNSMDVHWVRYAWHDTPDVNLFTSSGLPVTPFEEAL